MRKTIVILLLMFIVSALSSCSKQISYTAYEELIVNLEDMSLTVDERDVEESILAGERKWLTINENDNISVYVYESSNKMEEDATCLSDDGFSYNNGKKAVEISWISNPHFFKTQNMIILYVGENLEIIHALEELVGSQFAGHKE